jgi:hypothetical protein
LKQAWIAALFAAVPGALWAQGNQEELVKKRDKKLAEEWVKNANWITDYTKAREEAKKAGKLIFAYFTRSYAF